MYSKQYYLLTATRSFVVLSIGTEDRQSESEDDTDLVYHCARGCNVSRRGQVRLKKMSSVVFWRTGKGSPLAGRSLNLYLHERPP